MKYIKHFIFNTGVSKSFWSPFLGGFRALLYETWTWQERYQPCGDSSWRKRCEEVSAISKLSNILGWRGTTHSSIKAQQYPITLSLEWETLRNFYSLIVNEPLMILDNVSINTFQTLNPLFLGNYDHWVCPYLDQDLWSKIIAGVMVHQRNHCILLHMGFIGFLMY